MPVDVTELYESREIDRSQDRIKVVDVYSIEGVSNPRTAESYGPSFDDTTDHDGITLQVQNKKAVRIAPDSCRLTVTFGIPGAGRGGGGGIDSESWEMDLTAGTEHISAVRKTDDQKNYPEAQDVGAVIGLTPEGRAEGVSKYAPKATLTVTKYWKSDLVTASFLNIIYNMTSRVNSTTFKGWEEGDLLFLGARMRSVQSGYLPIVYTFIGSSHFDNIRIETIVGDQPVPQVFSKRGWEYLWFDHLKYDASIDGKTIAKEGIKGIHVANIYEPGNFADLGLDPELT